MCWSIFGLTYFLFAWYLWNVCVNLVSGMPVCDAFARIEEQPDIYDVVHVKYSDEVLTVYYHVWDT